MEFQFGIVKPTFWVRSNGKMRSERRFNGVIGSLVLSPNSEQSMWVKRELSYALQQKSFENRIIPINYQPANFQQLSWTLSIFQMVDFTGVVDDGYRALLRIWGIAYQP